MGSGTTSKILWHFTGGANWDESSKSRVEEKKSDEEALSALEGILNSNRLKSSSHPEFVEFHHEEHSNGRNRDSTILLRGRNTYSTPYIPHGKILKIGDWV